MYLDRYGSNFELYVFFFYYVENSWFDSSLIEVNQNLYRSREYVYVQIVKHYLRYLG